MSRSMPFTTSIIGAGRTTACRAPVGKGDAQSPEGGPAAGSLKVRLVGEIVDARLLAQSCSTSSRGSGDRRIRRPVEARRRGEARGYRRGPGRRAPAGSRLLRPRGPAWRPSPSGRAWRPARGRGCTNSTAALSRCWRSWIRRRIWLCTVTSSAVVGSSATTQLRPAGKGHGDQDALAHAAGQFVRIGGAAPAPDRGWRRHRADRRRAPSPRGVSRPSLRRSTVAICSPTRFDRVERGHRVLRDERDARGQAAPGARAPGIATRSRPSNRIVPRVIGAPRGRRPKMARAIIDLPAPDLADQPARPRRARSRGSRRGGCGTRRPAADRDVEILDREHRVIAAAPGRRWRGARRRGD